MTFVKNHQLHFEYKYFPSNKFEIGSDNERSFFKSKKWRTHPNITTVEKIYKDIFDLNLNVCPCQFIFYFSVLGLQVNKMWIADNAEMTYKKFYNLYDMESKFIFTCEIKHDISYFRNKDYINFLIESFSSQTFNIDNDITEFCKTLKNKEPITTVSSTRKICENRDALKWEMSILKKYLKNENSVNCRLLMLAYLRADYFLNNGTRLTDITEYKRKINNNKAFKSSLDTFVDLFANYYLKEKKNFFFLKRTRKKVKRVLLYYK